MIFRLDISNIMHDSACDVIVGIANEKNFGAWGNHMGLKLEIE